MSAADSDRNLPTSSESDKPSPLPSTVSVAKPAAGVRYQILRPHDKGGIGEVFVALDQELNRQVALKEIQERHAADVHSRGRFVREAEITGGLGHPKQDRAGVCPAPAGARHGCPDQVLGRDEAEMSLRRFRAPSS
jgi:serine/threonine protein kinase